MLFGPTAGDGNTIGYDGNVVQNTIAFNGGAGIRVNGGTGQSFVRNSIFSNAQIGIDLDALGITSNDALDIDAGPNGLQNFPTIASATLGGGVLTISGSLAGAANSACELQSFADPAPAAAAAEGKTYLGSVAVNTDAMGLAAFSFITIALPAGTFVTALATGLSGTSEFSGAVAVN